MPLYELVLDFDGKSAEELRLTDRPVTVGDTVQIGSEDWIVVRELAQAQRHHARFQLKRAEGMSQRAVEMQTNLAALNVRAEEQRERVAQGRSSPRERHG